MRGEEKRALVLLNPEHPITAYRTVLRKVSYCVVRKRKEREGITSPILLSWDARQLRRVGHEGEAGGLCLKTFSNFFLWLHAMVRRARACNPF